MITLLAVALLSQTPSSWKEVDSLLSEQKYDAALKAVEVRYQAAKQAANDIDTAKALITMTQLRIGLGGYETAVKQLKAETWPKTPLGKVAVELYYAHALSRYLGAYGWEIRQRERVESKGDVDLKAWTAEQILAEADRSFASVWQQREALGAQPLSALADYLTPNDYPKGVRDTLRDAVTYLWAAQLADSAHWSAEHSNELYRLDFKALLKGDQAKSAQLKLTDAAVHPLLKVGALFDDLEAWHTKAGHREAALNVAMEREAVLYRQFTGESERKALIGDLEARANANKTLPWSAAALAQVAEQVREGQDAVRARQIALAGQAAHPGSIGGQRCTHLIKSIEAPDYMLAGMQADGVERRSIEVMARNLPQVFFRAYRVEMSSLLTRSEYSMLPDDREIRQLLSGSAPVARWSQKLPATPDFQSHRTAVLPPMKESGLYAVVASAREDFVDQNNRLIAVNLLVTKLVMTVRRSDADGTVEALVVDGASGEPAGGVDVELWSFEYGKPRTKVDAAKTAADGSVRFADKAKQRGRNYFVVAHRGGDWAIDRYPLYFDSRTQRELTSALIYTDRSVYRPQQSVKWKLVAYKSSPDQQQFSVAPSTDVTVSLMDANYQAVETKTVKTNSYGSASGEFVLPTGRLLGAWSITARGARAAIRVEEYKRPTFEVSMLEPSAGARLNSKVTVPGEAKYYFGLPVTSGQVKWRVSRTPQWPWWWGWYGFAAPAAQTQVVATGAASLNAEGRFEVVFTPSADPKLSKDVTYAYDISADLTDEGGETRSASRSLRLGQVAIEARATLDVGFVREGTQPSVLVRRTDLGGTGRAGKGTWRLLQVAQPKTTLLPADEPMVRSPLAAPSTVVTEGDQLRPRWSPGYQPAATLARFADGAEVAKGELAHDASGEGKVALPKLAAGPYRLKYSTLDEYGSAADTTLDFVVAGPKLSLALPAHVVAEATSVPVGGTARLLVTSGLSDERLVLELFRDGKRYDRRVLTAGKDPVVIELPVRAEDRGGFAATVQAVRDYQVMSFTTSIFVPRDDKELKVEFSTFRDRIKPGSKETFRVTVKGQGAKLEAQAAEVLAYMYDQSLDIFAPHVPPSVSSLYPTRTGVPWARSTVGPTDVQYLSQREWYVVPNWPYLQPDQLKFYDEYGVGGPGARGMGVRAYRMRAENAPASAPAPARGALAESADAFSGEFAVAKKKEASLAAAPPPAAEPAAPPAGEAQLGPVRSNFAETAFFKPHLVPDGAGNVSFDFTVPDSVTGWNVWAHAITRDLKGGSVKGTTRSVKDLMVRPYLPRFLREGDQASLKIVVNNASNKDMSGELKVEIFDPETNADLAAELQLSPTGPLPFTAKAGQGATLTVSVKAPKRVGQVALRVVAKAGEFSDGELRPLPLLPSRMHLMQSRFVTLRDKDERTMTFDDLAKGGDATLVNEQLVVTVDAQLFFTVLQALPYLTNYPYECTEQTLNRFLSTGIVSSVFRDSPAVAKMAAQFAKRDTPLETFDTKDPNRKLLLEESPWLIEAKGGKDPRSDDTFINMLDPKVIAAERASALAKLKKAQRASGAFPWWPGGPDSQWMTLYLAHGFAKAAEFKVEVPKEMVQRAWQYLANEYRGPLHTCMALDGCWETITFFNYVASAYTDESWVGGALTAEERKQMLDFSFKHWKQHSPYLKGYLALTLKRMGRAADATLVFDSVMDSAKTTRDEGTFWQPEDRSWLWYNDTIETHAFALRTLTELKPTDSRRDGLVQWLLLNKKLNQWKSTRATAEVIYSLVHYLTAEKQLGIREESVVKVGPISKTFVFEPDKYTGKQNQLVVPGPQIDAKTMSTVKVSKATKGFQFASATWHFSTEQLPAEARGDLFQVSRTYFKREKGPKDVALKPLAEGAKLEPGDEIEVQLSIRSKAAAEYVHLRDPRGAGFEPEGAVSRFKWNLGIGWYEEYRDSGTNFFFEQLPAGEYTFKYRLRAATGGTYRVGPATMQSMYAPEFTAYSQGHSLTVSAGGR